MIAQILVVLVPVVILVCIGLATALLGLLQYRLAGMVSSRVRVAAALFVIGVGALLSIALTTRTLNESVVGANELVFYDDYAGGFAASRWLSLLLLGAAVVEIVRGALLARRAAAHDPAWPLLAAMALFYVGTMAVQAWLSEHVGFSHKELYVPIMLVAIYVQPLRDLQRVLEVAKATALALVVGSLAGMLVAPDFVMHRPEPGILPGIDWRLFGLTGHANTLGPVGLLVILLELYTPFRQRWMHWATLVAAGAVVVLAQSRTAWAAAALILMLVCVPIAMAPERGGAGAPRSFPRAVWTLVATIAVLLVLTGALGIFGGLEYVQRKTELGTLNGRFQIWDITLQAWRENVLFGYGPEVWGADRRLRFNMFHVGQAHNQFVQTLGEAGLVGLFLLVVYLLTLLYCAWRMFSASRGLILALLVLLLARCVTEAPMRSEGLLSWSTFLHALLLTVACHAIRAGTLQPAPRHAGIAWRDRESHAYAAVKPAGST